MVLFLGCATTSSNMADSTKLSAEWAGGVYYPKLPSDNATFDAVKKDLADLLSGAKAPGIKYHGQKGINTYLDGEESLKLLLKGKRGSITFWYDSKGELLHMVFDSIDVLDDRISVSPRVAFFYTDLLDNNIAARKTDEWPAWGRHIVDRNSGGSVRPYKIHFPGVMSFLFVNPGDAQRFADDLLLIQQAIKKDRDARRAVFEAKAAEYSALRFKPPVSEEQRKYIVQANVMSQQKQYDRAIDLYDKVIEIDPVSYPAAYFNMALLYAQIHRFNMAISSMKQYLVLEPKAKDARSAQDKIYEWELMVQENQQ